MLLLRRQDFAQAAMRRVEVGAVLILYAPNLVCFDLHDSLTVNSGALLQTQSGPAWVWGRWGGHALAQRVEAASRLLPHLQQEFIIHSI